MLLIVGDAGYHPGHVAEQFRRRNEAVAVRVGQALQSLDQRVREDPVPEIGPLLRVVAGLGGGEQVEVLASRQACRQVVG